MRAVWVVATVVCGVVVWSGCQDAEEGMTPEARDCFPDGVQLDGKICEGGEWRELPAADMRGDAAEEMAVEARDLSAMPDAMMPADLSDASSDLAHDMDLLDMSEDFAGDMGRDQAMEEMGGAVEEDLLPACGMYAADQAELDALLAQPRVAGDVICLRDGTWTDFDATVRGEGSATQPVVLRAEHEGEVVATGSMRLRMAGRHVWVSGLRFEGGSSKESSLIQLRESSSAPCRDCRLRDVTIRDVDLGSSQESKWVSLYGERNRVDHCWFEGKRNAGALMVVWRPAGAPAEHHRIDHNYFFRRPSLGANGGEAIRVGTSDTHDTDSHTVVERNLFEEMDGEIEVVSNKSGKNRYLYNTFLTSAGQLTMRHGKGCHIEGNLFLARGKADAGGIRLIDSGHVVINNYVEGVRTSSNFRGGIVLVGGEEGGPMNGYQPVKDVVVAFNTIVDSEQSLFFGAGDAGLTVQPENVSLLYNLVARGKGEAIRERHGLKTPLMVGNQLEAEGGLGVGAHPGLIEIASSLEQRQGLWRPDAQSPTRDAATAGSVPGVVMADVDGEVRQGVFDVGADEDQSRAAERAPLSAAEVGPRHYRP